MNSQVVSNMLSRSRQSVSVLSFFALPFNSANLIKFLVTIICLGGLFASPVKAAVKTYYAQEDGSCGSSYGTGGNVWKPAAEGNSGSCTSRSTLGGRWDSGSARDMLIAYTPPYASQTTITGQAGSNIRFTETGRGGFTGRVRFVEINAAGNTILGNLTGEVTTSVPDSGSRNITDLSALSGTISAGNRLGMVVAITNTDAEAFTYFGDNGGGSSNEAWFVVDEVSAGNAAPTLTINEPNGVSDTVTQGASYNINYDLADSDDTVTAAFYYDTDNTGLDGTPISGACASAAEGTGATCSWDTTSIPTGSYYIYGITNDGSNPAVSAYSSGQITINSGGGGGGTPPTFDSVTNCASSAGSNLLVTCSNHTTASCSDRLMLVFTYYDGNEDISFGGGSSSIRIDPTGANLEVITATSLEAYANGGTSNTQERVKVYSYVNPPSGTYNVDVRFNNNNNHYAASVATFCGVDTTDPIGATGTNTGTGNSQTVSVTTTVADSLIVGGLSEKSGTSDPFTPTGGTVERWDFDTGAQDLTNDSASAGGEKSAPTAGVYSLDFTSSRSDNWAFAAVEVKAAPPPPNTPPTLTVNEPNGVSDTVTQGASYNINYDLADSDDTVTAAFYYDTDNTGLDGTPISGACASAAEGTGATCSWDTSSVTPGTYYVYGITDDGSNPAVNDYSPGQITINAPNSPPTLTVNEPNGVSDTVTQGGNYSINYNLADSDDVVTVAFYYDTNNSGLDGTPISGACATASEGTGVSCSWNTTGVTPGTYYVYGITNDGTNPAVNDYSPGQITINAPNSPPTLTVNEPNGVSDTVTQGANYSINYSLADSDDVVTVAFFYDTNNTGLDGTAISGTCASAAEGTGATCSWDTTSITPGTYYVYGITNDGTNPAVNDYSPGQITINAPNSPPTLTVNEPNGVSDTVTQGANYSINYDLADAEDVVTVAFYYDTNNSGLDGTAISGACATAAEGTGAACSWDTTGVTPGTYYVYGVTNDGTNPAVSDYSAGQITINAAPNSPPSLIVNDPDGVSDTVTQGANYSINYDLADSDDVVTVAFYYDTNNSGLDGTAISGACASAAEGTGVTCSWDTTGVTPGTYYVYGITNDGTNPAVNDYSPGQITIDPSSSVVDWGACRTENGRATMTAATGDLPVTLGLAVSDPAKAFVLVDSEDNTASNGPADDYFVSGYIQNDGSLRFQRQGTASEAYASYTVVECFNDELKVQRGEYTLSSTSGNTTIGTPLTTAERNNSIVVVNVRTTNTVNNNSTQDYVRAEMTANDTITFTRPDSGSNLIIRWEVVTFEPGVNVYADTYSFTANQSTDTNIGGSSATVDPGRSWLYFTATGAVADDALQAYEVAGQLDASGSSVKFEHYSNSYLKDINYYVVEFPAGSVTATRNDTLSNYQMGSTTTVDIPITVTANKSFPFVTHSVTGTGDSTPRQRVTSYILNDTTLRNINQQGNSNSAHMDLYWQVIEFNSSGNAAPTLTVNDPDSVSDTVTQGANYSINYDLADSDDVVTVAFYYDTNNTGLDGTAISGACASAAEGTEATCSWDTTDVTPGTYYVYGITNDGTNPAVSDYSPGQITINAPNSSPTLTVNEPNGVGDTVTQGSNYSINYNLADSDDIVTVAFYYDTDNSGLDGTAISGACSSAAEGTGATCSWNTTGVTPGTYYVYGITDDGSNPAVNDYSPGQITISLSNNAATLVVNQPDGVGDTVVEGDNFTINYDLSDSDDVTTVAFYYDVNNSGADGTAIGGCSAEPEATGGTCVWNTSGVTPGSYYVYGTTSGDGAGAATVYSSGQITINAAPNSSPTLTVNEPNGVGDTVTQGSNYSINYDLADPDDVVTVAFYYDTTNTGLDGIPIIGACASAAEGTGAACSWNTTGVTPGTYYIYGITSDGTNPAVNDYSPGTITINAAPIPLSYASGDDGTNPGGGDSIAGISRVGGGDDSNNLESNKWKINLEWEFRIDFFDDSGESPVVEPMLYIAHRNSPTTGAGGDFFVYPLDCTGVTWGNGKTCATTMKLGPAASHKFFFYAEKTDGTGVRIPSSGYTDGPLIQLIDGYSLVGAARDIDGSNHDGSAAFNSPYSYSWVSLGLDTSFGVTFNGNYESVTNFGNPAETGRGYYSYKWANTLPELGANADVTAASHTITLQAGWNIISNPYNGNVKLNSVQIRQNGGTTDTWSNAAGSNWIEPAIYYYLGSDWGDSHTSEFGSDAELVPWMGYWIYVKDDINSYELIITKPAQ